MLCKRTYKNQITLPKKIMEDFKDVEYFEAKAEGERFILEPMNLTQPTRSTIRWSFSSPWKY
ncbi:MAG: hypothetical protein ACUVV5_00915 [Candidatus Aminicenantales bacterium]